MKLFKYYIELIKIKYNESLIILKFKKEIIKYNFYFLLIGIIHMKNIFINILKYSLILISFIFYLPYFYASGSSSCNLNLYDFIGILLPLIATIVTIALSLQGEEIYGISSYNFRRLMTGFKFTILEMVLIIIFILSLNAFGMISNNKNLIIYLNVISLFYSVVFIIQEILILIRYDKYLMFVIKKFYINHPDEGIKYGKDSKSSDCDKVFEYLILNKGINRTYICLKTKSKSENLKLLAKLLDISNKHLTNLISNKEFILKSNNIEYIDQIKNFININTTELNLMFVKTKDFNPSIICKNNLIILQLAILTNNLKTASLFLKMDDEFNEKYKDLLNLFKIME